MTHMNRKTSLGLAAATLSAAFLSGCSSSYVVLLENPDGTTGQVVVTGSKGAQVIDKANTGVPTDGSKTAAAVPPEQLKQDFGAAMAARPLLPERYLLYFESGGAKLTAESNNLLPKIIESVSKRPGVDVSIIGHTDTVGKADVNEALALKRAQAIGDLIKEKGLKLDALSIESHGEKNPLIKTADETPEPQNRRVEISIR